MLTYAVYDTETTNLWDFKKSSLHPRQPWPVETSVILYDADNNILEDITIYTIPPTPIGKEAEAIHGISNEWIHQNGVSMEKGMKQVREVMGKADILVGFNVDFDTKILGSAVQRTYASNGPKMFDIPRQKFYCVMKKLTPILKLRGPRNRGYKWPRLEEALKIIYGYDHADAHAARADVVQTARLFQDMMKLTNLEDILLVNEK